MKKSLIIIIVCLLVGSVASQAQRRRGSRMATYQKQKIECLGVEGDGSQTLRVTGTGRNVTDAKEQAKKDAVMAVIFDGIRSGMNGCDSRPLIQDMEARDKYEEYFDIFFMDHGEYLKYVTTEDRRIFSDDTQVNKSFRHYRLTVRVLRSELKQRLIDDGLIRPKYDKYPD